MLSPMTESMGKVYLVGAGPGDPGLLTLRGRELLARADVLVYDALVHPALLEFAPGAERIYAGKQHSQHTMPQEDINRLLIAEARRGREVVRLKGGDPFVFGRGGEEALALAAAGVPFEIVPGVTAGVACAAYAGIPVTHRGLAASVTLVSGHRAKELADVLDVAALPQCGTLVFYMTVTNLAAICAALVEAGRAPDTPAAIIQWGTYARQRTIQAALRDVAGRAGEAGIAAPAVLVVGEAVALREQLAWFESRPLSGLRVALTHTRGRQGELEQRLRELGADVCPMPAVAIAPAPDAPPLPDAGDFDWVVFTSANAVEMVFADLDARGKDARALAGVRLCAAGASTEEALARRSLRPDAVPAGHEANVVLAAMEPLAAGTRVYLPRSDIARADLAARLGDAGAAVTEAVAYRAQMPAVNKEYARILRDFGPDLVVFTNSAAARNFAELLDENTLGEIKSRAAFASLGPVTTCAATAAGITIALEATRHNLAHLAETICTWHAGNKARERPPSTAQGLSS